MSLTLEQINALLDKLEIDINTLNAFVHGDESKTVPLGGKATDSLRRLVDSVKTAQNVIADELRGFVGQAAGSATAAGQSATQSASSATAASQSAAGANTAKILAESAAKTAATDAANETKGQLADLVTAAGQNADRAESAAVDAEASLIATEAVVSDLVAQHEEDFSQVLFSRAIGAAQGFISSLQAQMQIFKLGGF